MNISELFKAAGYKRVQHKKIAALGFDSKQELTQESLSALEKTFGKIGEFSKRTKLDLLSDISLEDVERNRKELRAKLFKKKAENEANSKLTKPKIVITEEHLAWLKADLEEFKKQIDEGLLEETPEQPEKPKLDLEALADEGLLRSDNPELAFDLQDSEDVRNLKLKISTKLVRKETQETLKMGYAFLNNEPAPEPSNEYLKELKEQIDEDYSLMSMDELFKENDSLWELYKSTKDFAEKEVIWEQKAKLKAVLEAKDEEKIQEVRDYTESLGKCLNAFRGDALKETKEDKPEPVEADNCPVETDNFLGRDIVTHQGVSVIVPFKRPEKPTKSRLALAFEVMEEEAAKRAEKEAQKQQAIQEELDALRTEVRELRKYKDKQEKLNKKRLERLLDMDSE